MEIITGYTGKSHVTSEMDRDVNIGLIGGESYVLQTGMQLEAEVSSNNEIKIRDGVLMHQGCTACIKKNTYDSLTIINGSQGMKRIDLIVARYEKNQNDGTENLDLLVIQGTPAESNPAVPDYTEGDIQSGDYIADMPLYQVVINGLNITEVRKMFSEASSIRKLQDEKVDKSKLFRKTARLSYFSATWMYASVNVGKQFTGCIPQVTLMYKSSYPVVSTINVSAEEVDANGNAKIWAYGSGYVSGHVMNVLVDCRAE